MSRDSVRVRAIRPHDTSEGWKAPGNEYERTKADADQLEAAGIVSIVPAAKPAKSKATH